MRFGIPPPGVTSQMEFPLFLSGNLHNFVQDNFLQQCSFDSVSETCALSAHVIQAPGTAGTGASLWDDAVCERFCRVTLPYVWTPISKKKTLFLN